MPILNFVLDTFGQAGQVPKFVYFQTNDTLAKVTSNGYLNHFVEQGNQLNVTSVALVVSQESLSVAPVSNLYHITYSGGNWSLVEIGAGGGSGFDPATSYNAIANPAITGDWLHEGGFNVQAGTGSVTLQSDTGAVNILAPNSGQFVHVTASNVALAGSSAVTVTGGSLTVNMSGNASIGATGPLSLSGSSVALVPASVASLVTSQALYYNSSTGVITRGAPGSIDTSLNYTWTGTNQFNGPFAVSAPTGDVSIGSSAGGINLLAPTAGKTIAIQSPTVSIAATTAFNSTAGSSSFQTTGSGTLAISAGGVLSLQGAGGINMPTLSSAAATANSVFYNASTGFISYAPASTGGTIWSTATGLTTLVANHGYIANSASLVSFDLPTVAAVGAEYKIVGQNTGGWTISLNSLQSVNLGSTSSTVGTSGAVSSSSPTDCVSIVCTVANTSFAIYGSVGNINLT